MAPNITVMLVLLAATSIAAQTFQYSRGWTNGKRGGRGGGDVTDVLQRALSPCQLKKIKYMLEGKPIKDRFYTPCVYDEDVERKSKLYKSALGHEPLFDIYQ